MGTFFKNHLTNGAHSGIFIKRWGKQMKKIYKPQKPLEKAYCGFFIKKGNFHLIESTSE